MADVSPPASPTDLSDALPKRYAKQWLRTRYAKLLDSADIALNGPRPWDLQVHDQRLYTRCLREGTLGLGDAYV